MRASKPFFLALAIFAFALVVAALSACAEDATETMAGGPDSTTAASPETTTTTMGVTTTTQTASTMIEITTTSSTLPPGGPGPARLVASVSFDGESFQEDWSDAPCAYKDLEKSVMKGTQVVKQTIRQCGWPFWVRLTERNGVAVWIEGTERVFLTETGEKIVSGSDYNLPGDIVIPPHGTYERGFRPTSEDGRPDIAGRYISMTFSGYDANGNDVELEVRFKLLPPQ